MDRKTYYENIDILFELIFQSIHRETAFIPYKEIDGKMKATPPIRWLNASAIRFLVMHWNRYQFLEKKMNLYHSLATYKDFPMFSYNWREKSQQQRIWLTEFAPRVKKYDFLFENDSDDIGKAKKEIIESKEFFDRYKAKYYLKFSGNRGFHIVIPYEEFEFLNLPIYSSERESKVKDFRKFLQEFPVERTSRKIDLVLLFKVMAHRIKLMLALDTIDTSVQDVKRVVKSAYSWDVKSDLIAYPLTDEQLLNFRKEDYTPEKVLKMDNHKRRLLWRNDAVPLDVRNRFMEKMLVDLGIFNS